VHRPRDVTELEPILRRGIPTTRPLRTICDLGAVDGRALGPALHHFLAEGTLSVDAARRALARHRGRGRSGAVALDRALADLAHLAKPPDSELEIAMARLFRRHGLPPFEFHARIAGWEVDFLIVGTCVVIETDGWTTHGVQRDQFERDRAKDADLQAAGYVVQRFTWQQVTRDQSWVAQRIRALVRQWAPAVITG
jgi:very-short-patch-repair endonuclease